MKKQKRKRQIDDGNQSLRCFLGIHCPLTRIMQPLFEDLKRTAEIRSTRLRVVPEANLHITLRFLGSVPVDNIDEIIARVSACLPGHSGFELNLRSLGFFRGSMWLGVEDCQLLDGLVADIDRSLKGLGLSLETKAYHPHVTVARFGSQAKIMLSRFQQRYLESVWGTLKVDQFHLYRSETLPQGARYSVLKSFEL